MYTTLDEIFDIFDWDKKSYKFNREEKDMHPYSIIKSEDKITIIHNVLGLEKKDLKVFTKDSKNGTELFIQGATTDSITKKNYSINSKFSLDITSLDIEKTELIMKNGLLYIIIPKKKEKQIKPQIFTIK